MLTVVRADRDRYVDYWRPIESKAAGALAGSLPICGPGARYTVSRGLPARSLRVTTIVAPVSTAAEK